MILKFKFEKKIINAISYIFIVFALFSPLRAEGRRITMLELSPMLLNFKFSSDQTFWISSQNDFKKFWMANSRTAPEQAPTLAVDWKTESLLAIFWKSEDGVIRFPNYLGLDEVVAQNSNRLKLRLNFVLHTPCFGIITDQSPARFLIVGKDWADIDEISVRTDQSKQIGCF